jgi:hypothetical protein
MVLAPDVTPFDVSACIENLEACYDRPYKNTRMGRMIELSDIFSTSIADLRILHEQLRPLDSARRASEQQEVVFRFTKPLQMFSQQNQFLQSDIKLAPLHLEKWTQSFEDSMGKSKVSRRGKRCWGGSNCWSIEFYQRGV